MIEYTGKIECITDTHSMRTVTLPFRFEHKMMLTRNEVKKEALNVLHEQAVIYGISSIKYKWRVL